MSEESPITERTERLEEIIAALNEDEVSLAEAKDLHAEGQALLEELRDELELGEGTVVESE